MRGSPLLRTFLILILLLGSGLVIAGLTRDRAPAVIVRAPDRKPNQPIEIIKAKAYVTLSGKAESVKLFANAGHLWFGTSNEDAQYSGDMKIDKDNPVINFKVVWLEKSASRRFAKLVVEAEGKDTFTHVFDSAGDIDDFVELPF